MLLVLTVIVAYFWALPERLVILTSASWGGNPCSYHVPKCLRILYVNGLTQTGLLCVLYTHNYMGISMAHNLQQNLQPNASHKTLQIKPDYVNAYSRSNQRFNESMKIGIWRITTSTTTKKKKRPKLACSKYKVSALRLPDYTKSTHPKD